MKKNFWATLLVAVSLFLSVGKIEFVQAKAQTPVTLNTFEMEDGAAVRLKTLKGENGEDIESNGLRFSAEISADEFSALQQAGARFGAIIVAKDLLKTTDINENTVFGNTPAFYFTNETGGDKAKIAALHITGAACQNIDEDANVEICGAIVNLKTNNFTRSFVGRVYVAIPSVNAETGAEEWTYHFAPYHKGNIENNTRCMFYVAQRAIEDKKSYAATLEEKYVTPFKATDRYTKYTYRYYVEHHYIVHDEETGEHKTAHIETKEYYDTLDTQVTAQPIEKPTNVPAIENLKFVYDVDESAATKSGLVYAAGMQKLKLYYETAATIDETHKQHTLETLVADFLDVNKAKENFGLHINGNAGDWVADAVPDPADSNKQIGISLTATQNASKNRYLLLSKHFFDQLRAFGVESISFDFHTAEESGKAMRFYVYQEEDESLDLPVYSADGKTQLTKKSGVEISAERITVKIADITPGGGLLIEVHQSSSSNKGIYHFGHMTFTFPTSNTGVQP